jgi:hypothetical protein
MHASDGKTLNPSLKSLQKLLLKDERLRRLTMDILEGVPNLLLEFRKSSRIPLNRTGQQKFSFEEVKAYELYIFGCLLK